MKQLLLLIVLALLAGCAPDQIPHCSRCYRKYPKTSVFRDTTYTLCDKTYGEIHAWEAREDVKYPDSQTDCLDTDTTK